MNKLYFRVSIHSFWPERPVSVYKISQKKVPINHRIHFSWHFVDFLFKPTTAETIV